MTNTTNVKTTVIYHSADFDGLFCGNIARKFLGTDGVTYIPWDFGDKALEIPSEGRVIIMDLPVDRVFGFNFLSVVVDEHAAKCADRLGRMSADGDLIWIDHHASSIASHPQYMPGYQIDGVSACRLAWQWFIGRDKMVQRQAVGLPPLPLKEEFVSRKVDEPLAVRLAGEYDVWDKRDPDAEVFQFGLRCFDLSPEVWGGLLETMREPGAAPWGERLVADMLEAGLKAQFYQQGADKNVMTARSFLVEFEGLKFLALNTSRCNSLTFAAKDVPETGHDALMGFFFNGSIWKFSLYGARHNLGLDLSAIAKKYGGGGHRQACGFEAGFFAVAFTQGKMVISTHDGVWIRMNRGKQKAEMRK